MSVRARGEPPAGGRVAILDAEGHEKAIEAAEFLVDHALHGQLHILARAVAAPDGRRSA